MPQLVPGGLPVLFVAAAAVGLLLCPAGVVAAAPEVSPGDATWHVGLVELWGKDPKGNEGRNLDIYPCFEKGKWARALATARRFNTSVHLVTQADITLSGDKVTGTLHILLTPDQWVPKGGRPIPLTAEIDGKLVPGEGRSARLLRGTYKAVLEGKTVTGQLIGGVGATETGWDDCGWSLRLNQVADADGQNRPQIIAVVGVADGKVHRGRIGASYKGNSPQEYPFDPSGLTYDGAEVHGQVTVPARAVEVTADAKATCDVGIDFCRVQGMVGGKATFTMKLGDKVLERFEAYGRGGGNKGVGRDDPKAAKPLWKYGVDTDPWWLPVKGFAPPKAGEHPRLFFRKQDVAGLRAKADTPEGKAILARLRRMLDGADGETLAKNFNPTPPDNHDKSPNFPMGSTFTSWHGVGYALLHTLTGEARYADLARKSLQLMFDGKMDIDNRYGWKTPGTIFRAGPVLAGVGLTYDMCYDAWPADFRKKVALSIQDYAQPCHETGGGETVTLKLLAGRTGYPPGSNHYGAHVAAGTGVLAILGDPGVDAERMKTRLAEFERDLVHSMVYGFGDGGAFAEEHHPGRVTANLGILPFMMALRSAAGRDYIAARRNARWITLRWIMELVPTPSGPHFPHRGVYGQDNFDMGGMSHDGEFAYGFGCIDEKQKPALLWTYENFIKPHQHTWGAATYPNRAVAALVNWPAGTKPVNPGEALPRAAADTIHGYFMNRNRWQGADDVIITTLLDTGPAGYYQAKTAGKVLVWGLGLRGTFSTGLRGGIPTVWKTAPDGSSVLSVVQGGQVSSMAVDFSAASGAAAVIVGAGPAFMKANLQPPKSKGEAGMKFARIKAGGQTFAVLTVHKGAPPAPAADGDAVKIGKQTVRFDGQRLHLATMKD